MKRLLALIMMLAAALALTGCDKYPDKAADGAEWDKSWEILGTELGVEEPGHGFTLLENDVVLAGQDTYYAAWTAGQPTSYVNEDGKEVDLYPAQLYLLLYGCADESYAAEAMEEWTARQRESYDIIETRTETYNGQEYTVMVYNVKSESNPYQRGVTAFALHDNYVVSAELSCKAEFDGDEQQILSDFLSGCHYAAK